MFYIGIDVASRKHDCCILNAQQKEVAAFTFHNNEGGFARLLEAIQAVGPLQNAKVGLEATGIYGANLSEFLRRNGLNVTTINPLIIKKRQSATTLRKTKTDKTDARFLAHIMTQEDLQSDLEPLYHSEELKSLSRGRFQVVNERSALKNRATGLVTVLFPELEQHFSDIFCVTAQALLQKYPSAQDLACCDVDQLEELIGTASHGKLGRVLAEDLIQAANHSVGTYSTARALELEMLMERIQLCDRQIARFEQEIKVLMAKLDSPITTVPGIGIVLGSMILGEIGHIRRFATPAKLLAFAGLEPSVYQSGKYQPDSGSMVKRGSPYLRWALIQAAQYAARFDPTFRDYFQKKRSEGKHHFVALSHLAKKLVRILFALLKNNSPYSLDYSPATP